MIWGTAIIMKMLRHQMQNQRGLSQIGLCISHLSLSRLCGVHSRHSEYIWNECFKYTN